MKILLPDFAPDAELTDRFGGEVRTLARLEHLNIAKFHTAFKLDNQLVMIMEPKFVDRPPLFRAVTVREQ
jgi:hypothetical protein